MYTVCVIRDFVAQHYLIGGDWGAENDWHSHSYRAEVQLIGSALDRHNYLMDITDIEENLDALVAKYKDKTLNDLPAFEGQNPSLELFARLFAEELSERISAPSVERLVVKMWETPQIWASYDFLRPAVHRQAGATQAAANMA
ncbi:MAG: 6-carboxytetrahydropterin synthase [Sumerlaeia bacterium]